MPLSETGTTPAANPPPWGPDYRLEAISLAVELYAGQGADERTVLRIADEFYARLTLNRTVPPGVAAQILATLEAIDRKLDIMSQQQGEIDAATAALTALTGDVAANVTQLVTVDVPAIQAAIAALPASVNTDALDAAVAAAGGTVSSLDGAVSSVTALTQPVTPPAP